MNALPLARLYVQCISATITLLYIILKLISSVYKVFADSFLPAFPDFGQSEINIFTVKPQRAALTRLAYCLLNFKVVRFYRRAVCRAAYGYGDAVAF